MPQVWGHTGRILWTFLLTCHGCIHTIRLGRLIYFFAVDSHFISSLQVPHRHRSLFFVVKTPTYRTLPAVKSSTIP